MSDALGTYSFLPWLRLGIANNIDSADGDVTVKSRASIAVDLDLAGRGVEGVADQTATISRDVALYGPGDIIGIDANSVIKQEPRDWITNFEPNYLPYIEFRDPEFIWRYTPAAPDTSKHRLRPWLALVVIKEDEFADAPLISSRPLPAIEITGQPDDIFPPADQLWAWAHVHLNRDIIKEDGVTTSDDADVTRARVAKLLKNNADHAYGRLICPRRLQPNTGYHAFVVPSFESGRLAGLGLDQPSANPAFFATLSAWAEYDDRPVSTLYPYYRRWFFKTGTVGDFEYLVRLLKPRPADARLGRRDMDTQQPGSNISGISEPELDGVLRLGGALKVPDEVLSNAEEAEAQTYEDWDQPYPHDFQRELSAFINLAEDYVEKSPEDANSDALDLDEAIRTDPDPLITPPLYGRWHSLTDRLLFDADGSDAPQNANWVHELNLDPRFRVAAGFGTKVIQDNQEEYMDAAWEQVGDILEANRRIRLAQLAKEVSTVWRDRHLGPIRLRNTERGLTLMAPVQRRVMADGTNVRHEIAQSIVPQAAISAPMRRALRPRDHVAAMLDMATPNGAGTLVERINDQEISAAPPRTVPEDLPTVEEAAEALSPTGLPDALVDLLFRNPLAKFIVAGVLILLGLVLLPFLGLGALFLVALGVGAFFVLARLEEATKTADAVLPGGQSPDVIDALPNFPDFAIGDPDPNAPPPATGPGPDSPEAARFKLALKDTYQITSLSAAIGARPVRPQISVSGLTSATFEAINPQITVPAFTMASIDLPFQLVALNGEVFREAMAYPIIDEAMYQKLLDRSTEHFLPNIDKIPQNTITLLETNQRFIEAYMVGLNHEFSRELLWREYPTDQRGSTFRQFWDPSGVRNTEGLDREAFRESLRDIPPLHTWSRFSSLGDHDHREKSGETEEEIVVVVRGELLKKYPNAVIYAQKARWQLEDGEINRDVERELETEGPEEDWLRTPLYEARVDPDITFIGFDLTAEEVKGGSGRSNDTESGWFIVVKERPGETRFGLDVSRDGQLNVWNDLAWDDVFDGGDNGFLQIKPGDPTLTLTEPTDTDVLDKTAQYQEDRALRWHPDTNSAELAYILYQVPVLVAVHGSEMLPR